MLLSAGLCLKCYSMWVFTKEPYLSCDVCCLRHEMERSERSPSSPVRSLPVISHPASHQTHHTLCSSAPSKYTLCAFVSPQAPTIKLLQANLTSQQENSLLKLTRLHTVEECEHCSVVTI